MASSINEVGRTMASRPTTPNFMMEQSLPQPTNREHVAVAWALSVGFFAVGFAFSLWYLDAYYLGDTVAYTRFYHSLYQTSIGYWEYLQNLHLGSAEPFYRLIIGPAAFYDVDRIAYLSLWNGLLTASITYSLVKYRSSLIFALFMMTNYYLLVLLGPAERLKFAYICLIIAYNVDGLKTRFFLSAASIFFHTQALVQFASAASYWVTINFKEFLRHPLRTFIAGSIAITTAGTILYFFYETVGRSISDKSAVYSDTSGGLAEAVQWGMLVVAGAFVFRNRVAFVIGMLPMGALTILFGNRVNVATLVFFAVMALTQDKTRNPIVLAVMAYMSIKSVPFMLDVIEFGTGY